MSKPQLVFAVLDTKVESYMSPFTVRATGEAIRLFSDSANNRETGIGLHPEDYHLFQVGEWDPETGAIAPVKPKSFGPASQFTTEV